MIRISVCMTTYNSEKYIYKQISSILSQLSENDEIIICDDRSCDSTINIISSFEDRRIKVLVNNENLGFSKNFSKCIHLAEGEFIFLSDHDDIWLSYKVEKYLDIFNNNANITSIMSNMEIIDENDCVNNSRFLNLTTGYGNQFSRIVKNFVKSTYYGCSIAFRQELKHKILPLPFHFDTWIGLVSDLYGHCYHLDEVTMQYRRHTQNLSNLKASNIYIITKWRLNLFLNLFSLVLGIRNELIPFSFLHLLDI